MTAHLKFNIIPPSEFSHGGVLLFIEIVIFLEQIVRSTFEDIAQRLHNFEFHTLSSVVYHIIEILKTQPKLFIEPVFCFSFFYLYVHRYFIFSLILIIP